MSYSVRIDRKTWAVLRLTAKLTGDAPQSLIFQQIDSGFLAEARFVPPVTMRWDPKRELGIGKLQFRLARIPNPDNKHRPYLAIEIADFIRTNGSPVGEDDRRQICQRLLRSTAIRELLVSVCPFCGRRNLGNWCECGVGGYPVLAM